MSDSKRLHIFEANMHSALRSYHGRGGSDTFEPATVEMPFDQLIMREGDGDDLEGEAGEYEWRQRILGVRQVFRWILAEGFHPLKIMKRVFAIGRALNIEPFTKLTMTEQGQMFSETRAAVSWRMKVLSGLIKLQGMRGHRLSGQKSDRASEVARDVAIGNTNRARGAKAKAAARQGSFLRKLKVPRSNHDNHQHNEATE